MWAHYQSQAADAPVSVGEASAVFLGVLPLDQEGAEIITSAILFNICIHACMYKVKFN